MRVHRTHCARVISDPTWSLQQSVHDAVYNDVLRKKMSCIYNYYYVEGRNESRQKRFGPPPLHRRNSKKSVKKKTAVSIPEWNAAQYNNIINYVSLCAPPLHREDHARINDVALWAKSRRGRKLTYMHTCGYIYNICV